MMRTPHAADASARPQRVLGPVDAMCIVIGAIIGVGIFFNPSDVAKLSATPALALAAWAIAGLVALCGALVFAELGGMYHRNGAQYEIIRDTYGRVPAFLFVFCIATIIEPGSIAVMGIICAQNILVAADVQLNAPDSPPQFAVPLMAATLIAMLAGANLLGVRWGARIQNLSVYAKILTLLTVTALGLFLANSTPSTNNLPTPGMPDPSPPSPVLGLLAALVPTLFAYGGWQQALWNAGEIRDPRRNIPRAIILGVILVISIYLLTNWAFLRLLGLQGVADSDSLAADAVGSLWGHHGRRFIAAAVALSAFGVLNAQFLTAPWLIFGMARDGRFFRAFAHLSPRFNTPIAAIFLLTGISLLMLILSGKVNELVNAVVQVDAIFFALTGLALLILRRRLPNADRPLRIPLAPIVAMLFVIGELGAVIGGYLDPAAWKAARYAALWLCFGLILYFFFFRTRNQRQQPITS